MPARVYWLQIMKRCWLAGRLVGVFRSHSSVAAVLRRFLNDIGTVDEVKTGEGGGRVGKPWFAYFSKLFDPLEVIIPRF